jgi:hypothetical protein
MCAAKRPTTMPGKVQRADGILLHGAQGGWSNAFGGL